MTLDRPFIQEYLFDSMECPLGLLDFSSKKEDGLFRRETASGFQSLFMKTVEYQNFCTVEFFLGVRFHAIESLVQPFLYPEYPHEKRMHSLICPQAAFTGQVHLRYQLRCVDDIDRVLELFFNSFAKHGERFFEEFESIERTELVLNARPELPLHLMSNHIHRCFRSLAFAFLCDNPSFIELEQIYAQQLHHCMKGNQMLKSFRNFAKFLSLP